MGFTAKSLKSRRADPRQIRESAGARNSFPIVGVGASAGGLEAFTQLLNHLPENSGMAFVLVQHLDPGHQSQLTNLLAKTTKMSVVEVKNGMEVKPDHIFVIPPNKFMKLSGSKLQLTPRGRTPVPHPVDYLFSSLAKEQQNLAIGVVLSGTGSDGALGLKDIKEAGGITFAQDETSARFSGMPLHAAIDSVDFVLPPEKIALELKRIGQSPHLASARQGNDDTVQESKEYQRVLGLLRSQTGVDLTQYRDSTLKRRIHRRMVVRTRHTLAEYIELLEKEPEEITKLFDDALINVTSFFRDPEMFEALKTRVFPKILKGNPKSIRIWVAACSTGQEAYSVAMALLECLDKAARSPVIQIFATDISESISIEKGRRGLYPVSIESEVSPERLRRFFTKAEGGYRISKTIRELCLFARQNITADPPFSRMDLVTCRNLLIYFTPELQRQVISTFHYALNPAGYLVIGGAETVGTNSDLFELMDRKNRIYLKRNAANRPYSHFTNPDPKIRIAPAGSSPSAPTSIPADFQKEADRILLGRYAPAAVLVNRNLEVLQFRGRTSPYLELPVGAASFNLLKMARENLGLELGTAVREATLKKGVVRRKVRLRDADTIRSVMLEVVPVKLAGSTENCFLILFEDVKGAGNKPEAAASKGAKGKRSGESAKDLELVQLRRELAAAREYLQNTVEQQEAATEELKCVNEEALSGNEELQSTNEQLSTAKEELQSTNEELQTLNEELQTRNTELNQVNTDLSNLLGSVQVPIVMFNCELRVRRFNAAAVELLHLHPAMVGRPLHAIDSPLIFSGLEKRMLEVVASGREQEVEVRDGDERWFSLRIHPYRTTENRNEGIILTLVDINDLHYAHEKLLNYTTAIVDSVRTPLLVLRPNLQINSANEAFYKMFRMERADTENRFLHELGQGRWNIPELREALLRVTAENVSLNDLEVQREFPAVGLRDMLFNARPLRQKMGTAPLIFLSMDDVSESKRIERVNRWQAAIVESSGDAVMSKNLDGTIISCNEGALRLFGYQASEIIGKSISMLIPAHLRDEETAIIERIKRGERIENFETVRQRKDGSLIDLSITISPVKGAEGNIVGASKIARDITDRKQGEEKLAASLGREKEARQIAEKAGRAKDDFLAALSHELRTPLNPVLLLASDSAGDPELSAEIRGRFETIRKNIELEARLIDDMLDLTRIARGKLSLVLQAVDVRAALQEAVTHIQSELSQKHLKIVLKVEAENCIVNADPVRLQQIFWNVLKNALKFTPPDGKITVQITAADKFLTLKISDTGIGMTPAELANAFQAFSQGEHSDDHLHRFGGLGLGLAIAHRLVELHGGRIQAQSEGRDKGATFVIELPLLPKHAQKVAATSLLAKAGTARRAKGKVTGRHILLVEDHEPTRTSMAHLLKRRGYKISMAGTIAEALKIAKDGKIDFVISDIGLPDGSGNALMKELEGRHGVKGIALTGYGMEEDLERSHAAGFIAHLVKPVHVQALEAALASLEATL